MAITKDKVSVTMPADLVAEVRKRAIKDHRNFSEEVSYFLSLGVGQYGTNEPCVTK